MKIHMIQKDGEIISPACFEARMAENPDEVTCERCRAKLGKRATWGGRRKTWARRVARMIQKRIIDTIGPLDFSRKV